MKSDPESQPSTPKGMLMKRIVARVLIPAVILVGGYAISQYLMRTKPLPQTAAPARTARLVETLQVYPDSFTVEIESLGYVKTRSTVDVRSRVAGQIMQVAPEVIPGAILETGSILFRIDPEDYRLALQSQQAALLQAEASLLLEQGQQRIARRDYEITGRELDGIEQDLVLRRPQWNQAESRVQSAQAQAALAQLNLDRTAITAPFTAIVLEKYESAGATINANTPLVRVADCSTFWVELSVPTRDLRWIQINPHDPSENSLVSLHDDAAWGKGVTREGRIISAAGDVDPASKMARVIVEVDDPLALLPENAGKPRLLLGSLVRATIHGRKLDDVIILHRDHLRENNQVWTVDSSNRLVFTDVELLHSDPARAIVGSGLTPGSRIVTSYLSVPVPGMLVRYIGIPENKPESAQGSNPSPIP